VQGVFSTGRHITIYPDPNPPFLLCQFHHDLTRFPAHSAGASRLDDSVHAGLFPGLFDQTLEPVLIKSLFDVIEMLARKPLDLTCLRDVVEVFGEFQKT